ncbi:NAD(P)/FAD-dependent oxidoreductase [Amycolatopsis alkalitolerans]|uniref:NAD(P)/FAD-dependent oxidoreductase n=1 Tax=Amycolatopsis alkalitolerans TaxID=2547244 RepID=A0A5C4LPI6_9PSEU|nr:FAD-dependent oxidoreductase [Amycolatopsis alkalitolerans]TNC19398.1 NAD(P)/FAD-dependent oxidoreductase [Amycolatopsis alkalitolerans]
MTSPRFVIIGAGLAGAKTAESLRAKGFNGQVTIVGDEEQLPYERPPLSKDYLVGNAARDSLYVHDAEWYSDQRVELRTGIRATRIDRTSRRVELSDGAGLGYDKLLLATGASPRLLPDTAGVHYLRRIEDSDRLKRLFTTAASLIVVGGGWIGLEAAAAARQAGLAATVVEALELPLLPALGRDVATVFADLHRQHGVDLRLGIQVEHVGNDGQGTRVRLADGSVLEADAVVAGIGAVPNTGLAEACGLRVDNGVVVDANLRTSDPDIFAAGDVASVYHPLLGRHLRVEHWASALKQPAAAAASMLDKDEAYDELPYFYTDQYDLGMEFLGTIDGHDRVVFRGDLPGREFIAFWLKNNRVRAGMNVNIWDVTGPIKALIRAGRPVHPDRLADPGIPLDQVATA